MVVETLCSFEFLDSDGFSGFSTKMDQAYRGCSADRMATVLIPERYKETLSEMTSAVRPVRTLALTADGWKSLRRKKIYGVAIHFVDEEDAAFITLNVCNRPIKTGETAPEIAQHICNCLYEIDPTLRIKIMYAVTDRAQVMVAAMSQHLSLQTPFCNVHIVNIILKTAVRFAQPIKIVGDTCHDIAVKVRNTSALSRELDKLQRDDPECSVVLELIPQMDIRFATMHITIERTGCHEASTARKYAVIPYRLACLAARRANLQTLPQVNCTIKRIQSCYASSRSSLCRRDCC